MAARNSSGAFPAKLLALAKPAISGSSKVPDHDVARHRIFSPPYRLAKQVRLAVAGSKNCARRPPHNNQEYLVAKKAKKRTVRPYTKTEERELRAHSKAKTPVAKISKLTKRSVAALRKKAGQMGFPLGHRR